MSNYTKLYLGHYVTVNNNIVDLGGSNVINVASAVNDSDAINKTDMLNAINPVNTKLSAHDASFNYSNSRLLAHDASFNYSNNRLLAHDASFNDHLARLIVHDSKLTAHDSSFNDHTGRINNFNSYLYTQNLTTSSLQFANNNSTNNNVWLNTGAAKSNYFWGGITSDSTGQYLVACERNASAIYASSNYGYSWTKANPVPSGTHQWTAITTDSTGKYLAICTNNNAESFFISSDYGVSWTKSTTTVLGDWGGIISNSTGQKLAVCGNNIGDGIYLSSNYGVNWTKSTANNKTGWGGLAMSKTGKYIAASVGLNWNQPDGYTGGILLSSDNGTTWQITSAPSIVYTSITMSSTGKYLHACGYNQSGVYSSSDFGVTWTIQPGNLGYNKGYNWKSIKTNSTGKIVVVCGEVVYISTDYGSTWSDISSSSSLSSEMGRSFKSISLDGTGQYLVTGTQNYGIYTYFTNNDTINIDSSAYVTGDLDINGSTNFNSNVNITSSLALPNLITHASLSSKILSLPSNPSSSFNFFSITLNQDIKGLSLTNFSINGTYIVYITGGTLSWTISHTLSGITGSTPGIKTDYSTTIGVDPNGRALMKIYYDGTTYYVSCSVYL